ncbi:MAG: hypothetical protein U5K37_10990 [Natrialbaceae archaeon]|nr:hypothetical protein [Natrialbaceae archaeon]
MAFWMDPFIMLGCGMAIAVVTKYVFGGNGHAVLGLGFLTMLITYGIAIGLFVNASMLEPIWRFLGAETGTEFMLNGIVFSIAEPGLVYTDLGGTAMFLAIFIFTTYPVYLIAGIGLGRLLFGRHSAQGGIVGLLRPKV